MAVCLIIGQVLPAFTLWLNLPVQKQSFFDNLMITVVPDCINFRSEIRQACGPAQHIALSEKTAARNLYLVWHPKIITPPRYLGGA
jgi:hypothetical protein